MLPLRILIGVLIAAAIGVALIPLAVLLDLHEGGTGWGLCQQGIDGCRNSYFAGFELLAVVALVLFGIVALIAVCVRLLRWLERRQGQTQA
jgi:hypothetical protein